MPRLSKHDGVVYVSGQLPVDPASGEKRVGSIEDQAEQALRMEIEAIALVRAV